VSRLRFLPLLSFAACAHAPRVEPGELKLVDGTVPVVRMHRDGTIEAYRDVRQIAAVGAHAAEYQWLHVGRFERDGRITGPSGWTAEIRGDGSLVLHDLGPAVSGMRVADDGVRVSAASGCKPLHAWFTRTGQLASNPAVYRWSGQGVSVDGAVTDAQRRAALVVLALGRWWGTGLSLCDSPD
jgi:hypothetical protein